MKLNELTIKQAREKLDRGEITSVDLTKACLARIKEANKKLNACLTVCEEKALREAERADERISKGEKGELLGVPYLAKDNILTRGVRTTASSKILDNYIAPYDATIIKKLREVGAVLLGKTNLDEFAHGASTENSAYGPTHNPYDLSRVPGGSSGGSAAAVAADMCIFALGTDTGGSVRCPAAFCNIVGLKPTYGRGSRFGLIAMTSSTDVPGVLAKNSEDAAKVLAVIAGHDKYDATTPDVDVVDYSKKIAGDLKGMKIGIPEEFLKDTDEKILNLLDIALEKFKELGVEIMPVALPHAKYGIPVYYIITPSEVSSNLARFDGIRYGYSDESAQSLFEVYARSRGKGLGPEAKRRIMLGTYALSAGYYDAYYLQAQKVRTKIIEELDYELSTVDAIITPTQPDIAFKLGDQSEDPLKMYLEDIFLSPASLAGLPAISVPCGFSEKMPVGMQIIGKRFDEATILRLAHQYEQVTEWHNVKPQI
jgi:aspartyl-tRNA(Asn)/glutamyl-tRNA(Gln) amidotransferase subunit A